MAADVDTVVDKNWKMWLPLLLNLVMSLFTFVTTVKLIPKMKDKFIGANLFGIDMSKTTNKKM